MLALELTIDTRDNAAILASYLQDALSEKSLCTITSITELDAPLNILRVILEDGAKPLQALSEIHLLFNNPQVIFREKIKTTHVRQGDKFKNVITVRACECDAHGIVTITSNSLTLLDADKLIVEFKLADRSGEATDEYENRLALRTNEVTAHGSTAYWQDRVKGTALSDRTTEMPFAERPTGIQLPVEDRITTTQSPAKIS